jgi:hypothetical protein
VDGGALAGRSSKFDFKDPKGVNTVTFSLDAPLEAISQVGERDLGESFRSGAARGDQADRRRHRHDACRIRR